MQILANSSSEGRDGVDKPLLIGILALSLFGIVMIYSASGVSSAVRILGKTGETTVLGADNFFLMRQSVFFALGLVLMFVMTRLDYSILRKPTVVWSGLFLAFIAVLLTRSPLGHEVNGAYRWVRLGPVNVQPAEALKVALVIWLSYSLNKKQLKIKSFSIGFLPHLIIPGILMFACMLQPDFGTTVVMGILVFSLLFVAGAKIGYILLAGLTAMPVVYFLITGSEYRLARIMTYLDPLADRLGHGYQLTQSLFGYASGGVTGMGLGDGFQKFLYLPEAHNDFIGAIIGEELGMIGIWGLILMYVFVVARGITIGVRAKDQFGMLLSFGLSVLVAVQALLNLAVSMGLLPTKGLNLPFVSYGGSALMIAMATAGILLSVSRGTKYPGTTSGEEEAVPTPGNSGNVRRTSTSFERA